MGLKEAIRADLATINADMGNPVMTWKGQEYPCVAGSENKTIAIGLNGTSITTDLLIILDRSLFTDFPASQDTIDFDGTAYRIGRVSKDPLGATIRLAVYDPNKGVSKAS